MKEGRERSEYRGGRSPGWQPGMSYMLDLHTGPVPTTALHLFGPIWKKKFKLFLSCFTLCVKCSFFAYPVTYYMNIM